MADALFTRDGADPARWTPSELCRGPWSSDACHGGAVAALLARIVSEVEPPGPMHPARLTLELLRPVPLAPLAGRARVVRPGRKVQLVEASLWAGDAEVARATVLRVRRAEQPLPADHGGGVAQVPPGPTGAPVTRPPWRGQRAAYHSHAVEHRVVRGEWGSPGPCTDWMRLRVPLVAGQPVSAFERLAAVADFGNGISSALAYGVWRFINPDLTVHLQRLPRGEWVCLDAVTWPEEGGVGLAESELFDEEGRLGRALQTLLLEKA